MSNPFKVTLYILLVLIAGISGYFALANFGSMMARAGERHSELEQTEPERQSPVETEASVNTNAAATNLAAVESTNNLATNIASVVTTNTNAAPGLGAETNATEVSSVTNTSRKALARGQRPEEKGESHLGLWTALFVVSLIGLGLLVASDISHYMGNRALKVLYNDEGDGVKNPEYEKAEEVWANGDHLEAIKMMREYLARNPREQHVAIRIAEIYEKDLKNNLAAALEYEEVLKHKLQPERWGWAAIHLCNLYFRLNQEQKGFDLLRRIVNDYPNTAAAEKARKRLEQVEGGSGSEPMLTEPAVNTAPRTASAQPQSNLPPGFRPKK